MSAMGRKQKKSCPVMDFNAFGETRRQTVQTTTLMR